MRLGQLIDTAVNYTYVLARIGVDTDRCAIANQSYTAGLYVNKPFATWAVLPTIFSGFSDLSLFTLNWTVCLQL
jgi:hypothetical protein